MAKKSNNKTSDAEVKLVLTVDKNKVTTTKLPIADTQTIATNVVIVLGEDACGKRFEEEKNAINAGKEKLKACEEAEKTNPYTAICAAEAKAAPKKGTEIKNRCNSFKDDEPELVTLSAGARKLCEIYVNLYDEYVDTCMEKVTNFYNSMMALGNNVIKGLLLTKLMKDLKSNIDNYDTAYKKREQLRIKNAKATQNARIALAKKVDAAVKMVDGKNRTLDGALNAQVQEISDYYQKMVGRDTEDDGTGTASSSDTTTKTSSTSTKKK